MNGGRVGGDKKTRKVQQKGLLFGTLITGWDGIGVLWESS